MHRTVCGVLAASALLAVTSAALAQTAFAVNHFDPSERGSEWFALDSLDLRGNGRFALGVVGDYAYKPLVATDANGSIVSAIVRNQAVVHAGASLVMWDRVRFGLDLPVQVYADGDNTLLGGTSYPAPAQTTSLGDLRLGADVRIAGEYGEKFTLALGAAFFIPTGSQSSYSSDGSVRLTPHALVAGDIGMFVYAAKLASTVRILDTSYGPSHVGTDIAFGASVGLRVAKRRLVLGPEIFGNSVVTGGVALSERATPIEALFGAHYLFDEQFRVGAGLGTGLTGGYGTPEVRAVGMFEWMPAPRPKDRDNDGVSDADDACPDVAGQKTGDPRTNGCPPALPADRDHDGIPDTEDACADVPGVKSGDPKTNGCPADRDGDGIPDTEDSCVDDPGVKTVDPKTNGCPPDRDGDGALDRDDACPDVPGLRTDDPKTNGCPDPDRDKDGIKNEEDACPDQPGKADQDRKRNGCPEAFVANGEIKILNQVKFKTGSADILPGGDSEDVLRAVLDVFQTHAEIAKVRIEGHTDNRGAPTMNKKLSAARAASVAKWLADHGIDKGRLVSEGFGQDRPIDVNTTEDGRKNNRRVEFHIEP